LILVGPYKLVETSFFFFVAPFSPYICPLAKSDLRPPLGSAAEPAIDVFPNLGKRFFYEYLCYLFIGVIEACLFETPG